MRIESKSKSEPHPSEVLDAIYRKEFNKIHLWAKEGLDLTKQNHTVLNSLLYDGSKESIELILKLGKYKDNFPILCSLGYGATNNSKKLKSSLKSLTAENSKPLRNTETNPFTKKDFIKLLEICTHRDNKECLEIALEAIETQNHRFPLQLQKQILLLIEITLKQDAYKSAKILAERIISQPELAMANLLVMESVISVSLENFKTREYRETKTHRVLLKTMPLSKLVIAQKTWKSRKAKEMDKDKEKGADPIEQKPILFLSRIIQEKKNSRIKKVLDTISNEGIDLI